MTPVSETWTEANRKTRSIIDYNWLQYSVGDGKGGCKTVFLWDHAYDWKWSLRQIIIGSNHVQSSLSCELYATSVLRSYLQDNSRQSQLFNQIIRDGGQKYDELHCPIARDSPNVGRAASLSFYTAVTREGKGRVLVGWFNYVRSSSLNSFGCNMHLSASQYEKCFSNYQFFSDAFAEESWEWSRINTSEVYRHKRVQAYNYRGIVNLTNPINYQVINQLSFWPVGILSFFIPIS